MADTPQDVVNRELREFRRYTGDGLPGEPVNAPLPVGDPASGVWNPKKANLRRAVIAPLAETMAARDEAVAAAPSTWRELRDETVEARDDASEQRVLAQVARSGSEAALASANTVLDSTQLAAASVGYFEDTTAGISGTTDGDVFWTIEDDEMVYYENDGGSAVAIPYANIPTSQIIDPLKLALGAFTTDTFQYGELAGATAASLISSYGVAPFGRAGIVQSVTVDLIGSGNAPAWLFLCEPVLGSASTYKVVEKVEYITNVGGGVHTFPFPFGKRLVPEGGFVQFGAGSNNNRLACTEGGIGGYINSGAPNLREVGSEGVITNWAYTPSMYYNLKAAAFDGVGYVSDIAEAAVALREDVGTPLTTVGQVAGGNSTWSGYTRTFGYEVSVPGFLSSIEVDVAGEGTGEIHVYSKMDDGSYTLTLKSPRVTASGVNTLQLDSPVRVNPGDRVAFGVLTGGRQRYTTNVNAPIGFYAERPTDLGAYVTGFGQTRPSISFQISDPFPGSLVSRVDDLDERVTSLEGGTSGGGSGSTGRLKFKNTLVMQRFGGSTLEAGWTQIGGWTVANGLVSPAVGGWDCYALADGDTSIMRRRISAKFTLVDSSSVFGVCSEPPEGSGGAVALVDGVQSRLSLFGWTGASSGTNETFLPLPFALVTGRAYTLEITKEWLACSVILTDTVTGEKVTLDSPDRASGYRQWHGRAGVMFHSGAVRVEWFQMDALHPEKLRAVVIGDSNSEGNFLNAGEKTWAQQLEETRSLEGDIMVAPRAGDETPNFIDRKAHDLLAWDPEFVVMALGTNDTDQATWRSNMSATIAQIEALGAEPILCTQIPRTSSQALRTAMNDDVRNGYFGRYRFIDLALSVSLDNDGVTWDPAYDHGDGTHANAAGQEKMYQKALADAPFLAS